MKLTLNLDFSIPIWKFFYNSTIKIPYTFEYNNKKYENGITIVHFPFYFLDNINFINSLKASIVEYPNPILCAPDIETLNYLKNFDLNCNIILAGHNAFIDENYFTINKNINKNII